MKLVYTEIFVNNISQIFVMYLYKAMPLQMSIYSVCVVWLPRSRDVGHPAKWRSVAVTGLSAQCLAQVSASLSAAAVAKRKTTTLWGLVNLISPAPGPALLSFLRGCTDEM
jgi:hypothetical protein